MTTFQSISTFARVLRRWLEAVESGDLSEARFYAGQVKAIATLVSFDPAFKAIFEELGADCDSADPEHAARCVYAFVSAATEAAILHHRPGRE